MCAKLENNIWKHQGQKRNVRASRPEISSPATVGYRQYQGLSIIELASFGPMPPDAIASNCIAAAKIYVITIAVNVSPVSSHLQIESIKGYQNPGKEGTFQNVPSHTSLCIPRT